MFVNQLIRFQLTLSVARGSVCVCSGWVECASRLCSHIDDAQCRLSVAGEHHANTLQRSLQLRLFEDNASTVRLRRTNPNTIPAFSPLLHKQYAFRSQKSPHCKWRQ